ncbi:hypothetical protein GRI69_03820 [Erythrobacter vulgaris]|uniref:Uncharacterized protein n=1 Tax=Qipengyuania vulgaris TaxID=291985 RepID=A0A844XPP9_9SPHN|nr:hypothetical protein [Qipengyuania vulgaris]MXO47384.1 hypothetical protein [Qipengyuania vulgaris]
MDYFLLENDYQIYRACYCELFAFATLNLPAARKKSEEALSLIGSLNYRCAKGDKE